MENYIFEWDEAKNQTNIIKHNISFKNAQYAFADINRIIAIDIKHSSDIEKRYYCIGKLHNDEIVTVRFVLLNHNIRIIGAGYWRQGRKAYEEKNTI